jgi:PKHD-type hydroxylase
MSSKEFREKQAFKPDLTNYMYYEYAFTEEECDRIITLAKELGGVDGTLDGGGINNSMRSSELKWFNVDDPKYKWIYEKLLWHVTDANNTMWRFNLTGFTEPAQFTTYHANKEGKYHYHTDIGKDTWFRKISMTIQLSDTKDYDGGDLQFLIAKDPFSVTKKRGSAIVFPSYLIHQVTPVTRGKRDSLVIWVGGPPFM